MSSQITDLKFILEKLHGLIRNIEDDVLSFTKNNLQLFSLLIEFLKLTGLELNVIGAGTVSIGFQIQCMELRRPLILRHNIIEPIGSDVADLRTFSLGSIDHIGNFGSDLLLRIF